MTAPDQVRRLQIERQQAGQDIADIEFLQKCEPFNRYWAARLNALFQRECSTSRKGGDATTREEARIRANLLEELASMPGKDKAAAQAMLETVPADGQIKPRQVT